MVRALFLREFLFLVRPRNMTAIMVLPAASALILVFLLRDTVPGFPYPNLVLALFSAGAVLTMLENDSGNSLISILAVKHHGLLLAVTKIISSMSGTFLFYLIIIPGNNRFLPQATHIEPLSILLLPLLSTVTASWMYCLMKTALSSMLGAIMIVLTASCAFALSPSPELATTVTLLLVFLNFVILAVCAPRLIAEKR